MSGLRASADGKTVYFTMGGGSTAYDYSAQNDWALTQVTSVEPDMWPTPVKAGTARSFTVTTDDSAVGTVFGTVPPAAPQPVLDSQVSPPTEACGSRWEVSVTNNSAFVLATPTDGNVTGVRFGVPSLASGFLLPGQTGTYCVAFTGLNQVFDVRYDISSPLARVADAGLLLAEARGLPSDERTGSRTYRRRAGTAWHRFRWPLPRARCLLACLPLSGLR